MNESKIEWTDATWNPVSGCSKVSAGCKNCYAEKIAERFRGGKAFPKGFDVTLHPERLLWPINWSGTKAARAEGRSSRVFVNSMSDLFHENVPFDFIAAVFAAMAASPQHTFQMLTKRPERALEFFADMNMKAKDAVEKRFYATEQDAILVGIRQYLPSDPSITTGNTWPLPNVWLGVSVENQATANERIPVLLECPAAVRFLSCEPLLGPLDLSRVGGPGSRNHLANHFDGNALTVGEIGGSECSFTKRQMLHWVIAGGESGPGARPMHPDWARRLRDQCAQEDIPFFFKQWGAFAFTVPVSVTTEPSIWVNKDGVLATEQEAIEIGGSWKGGIRVGKKDAGRLLDGKEHNEFPKAGE